MPLSVGDKLGHYEVLSLIGEGGMGEVYRARDTTLQRDVALKVLPATFLRDPERLARFQREAQVLASLDHPNIGHIHGIVDSEDSRGLVLALIEGPTLADRIAAGAMPPEEAFDVAKQIVEALEYAHDRGVVHRDLKPANIKITPEGVVKVLDFGLAKVLEDEPPKSSLGNSPTMTLGHTRAGVILGTAAYMSPEQAVGRTVDRRSDIFSFGAVLYEMLTRKRAFAGETTPDVLEAVVKNDPDWSKLPAGTPTAIQQLLRRCLTKDRKQRLQAIGEARIVLNGPMEEPAPVVVEPAHVKSASLLSRFGAVAWGVAVVALALAGWGWWRATRPEMRQYVNLSVDLGPDARTGVFGRNKVYLSPDGARLLFQVGTGDKQQLAIRPLDQARATPLSGTENANDAFFSPDGQWIGFFADGKLKKIPVLGGVAVVLCSASENGSGSWGEDGTIVFSQSTNGPLSRVADSGGTPQPLTQLDIRKGEEAHRYPQILPGGDTALFTTRIGNDWNQGVMEVLDLKTRQRKILLSGGFFGRYLPTTSRSGYLLYLHESTLFAAPMDLDKLVLTAPAVPVVDGVRNLSTTSGDAKFDVSPSGTLTYIAGKANLEGRTLSWLDSAGKTTPLLAKPEVYFSPTFSPDGTHLALAITASGNIWSYDWQRDILQKISSTPGRNFIPVWTPDGKGIVYRSQSSDGFRLYWTRSDGASAAVLLAESKTEQQPYSFSPDGKRLAYNDLGGEGGSDLWTLPIDWSDPSTPKPGKPEVFLQTPALERDPAFSPDGRWVAYSANEGSNPEIYVRPFPASTTGGKWQISSGGGVFPVWSRNGRELFYQKADGNGIMVATYTAKGATFSAEKPRTWSSHRIRQAQFTRMFDLTPDGRRVVIVEDPDETDQKPDTHVNLLLNFTEELRRRVPAK